MSAEKKKQYRSAALKLCAGGLTVAVAGFVYFYTAPKIFRATAKAKIVKSGWSNTNSPGKSFGPERLPEECRTIRSDAFLDQMITNLDLNAYWGKKFGGGKPLSTEQTRERLKMILDVHPAPGAIMIEMQASGDDPAELAKIVNEAAARYADLRHAGRRKASHEELGALQARWEQKAMKAQEAESQLRRMQQEYEQERSNTVAVYDPKAIEQLQSRKLTLEDEYVKKTNDYSRLQEMHGDELKNVLSSLERGTNTPLTMAMSQVIKAKDALLEAERLHGTDAPETKQAAATLQERTNRVEELTGMVMSAKRMEAMSMKMALDRIDNLLQESRHATNNLQHFADEDAAYAKEKKEYDALVQERDELEFDILHGGVASAMLPDDVEAQIVELADPPVKPISPDERIVRGGLITGGVMAGAGLALLLLLGIKPRGAENRAG